jgi:hypothetical protein
MKRFRGWLSPGTVMGFMALVIALGGTAFAASGHQAQDAAKKKKKSHAITSATVKKIADAEIRKLAPTLSVAKANSANSATTAASADKAKIASNLYSANVTSDGTLLGSIPAGATSSRTAVGTYSVSFGRSLAGCAITTGAANNQAPRVAFAAVGVLDANTLDVFTRDPTNTPADEPFFVEAICPPS